MDSNKTNNDGKSNENLYDEYRRRLELIKKIKPVN